MSEDISMLDDQFAEAERRVRAIVTENAGLRKQIGELEQELSRLRREVQELQHFHGKRMHVREKLERILQQLDDAGGT